MRVFSKNTAFLLLFIILNNDGGLKYLEMSIDRLQQISIFLQKKSKLWVKNDMGQ